MTRKQRRAVRLEALRATKPYAPPESVRLLKPIRDRTSNLPVAVSYKALRLYRPPDIPATDRRWMGRDWKWREVRQTKRISSAAIPDFRVLNTDTTKYVIAKHALARLRRRGEMPY